LIRPIHALQGVLDKVSDGDLSVRADIKTRDEVEDLATSFNAMTESLLQRDQILESVRYAAQVLLLTPDWNEVVHFVLASLGQSTRVCRVDVFVIGPTKDGRLRADHPYAWTDPHGPAGAPRQDPAPDAGDQPDLAGLAEAVDSLGMTAGLISQLPHGFQTLFLPLGTVSVAAAPIKAGGALWGILSLSECVKARDWTESETDSLRAVADTLGAAIHRKSVQDALLDAKATLEHRVEERTQELQEQVAAKEKAHTELAEAQQHLMSASRQAGMAEVATGVLHNVGNVLNSINVSATLIDQQLKASEVSVLADLSRLLQQQEADLGTFLSTDPRGKEVLPFLAELADRLKVENTRTQTEHLHLIRNLDHVKDVINMQQSYGRASGYLERMAISGLMEDALRLHTASLRRHRIQVLRQFEDLPLIQVDKSKVLQILVNLVKNALESLVLSDQKERRLTVTISRRAADVVEVSVCDNGVGIPAENLTRIFSHGFSTRKGGHGFGLHIAALAAREMAGELRVHSAGAGLGALFTLSLPIPDHSVEEEEER
jgi:nitrogen fixation/metabolism regulation signal transduction histidine kinase